MTRLLLILAVLSQSGCVGAAIYGESRKVTREGMAPAMAVVAPRVANDAATDCAMKGLSQGELISLPNSGTLDDAAKAEGFARQVSARPGVAACLAALPRARG